MILPNGGSPTTPRLNGEANPGHETAKRRGGFLWPKTNRRREAPRLERGKVKTRGRMRADLITEQAFGKAMVDVYPSLGRWQTTAMGQGHF